MDTFKNIFESLVGEADYYQFDSKPSKALGSVSTSQLQTDVTGTGEYHGIDAGRHTRERDMDIMKMLGSVDAAQDQLPRNFIIAQIYDGLLTKNKSGYRQTYPQSDIMGAIAINPNISNDRKKYTVGMTAAGLREHARPLYYTIFQKLRDSHFHERPEEHEVRASSSFVSASYSNPKDYTNFFVDERIYDKSRQDGGKKIGPKSIKDTSSVVIDPKDTDKNDEKEKKNTRDSSSLGFGLCPQYSSTGYAWPKKSETNTTVKSVFTVQHPLKVSDLGKFITVAGASNGVIGHFQVDVFPANTPSTLEGMKGVKSTKMTLMQFMNRFGESLADGSFSGTVFANAQRELVTNREVFNPGVDNETFYQMKMIPSPDTGDKNWVPFLSEIAKTSTGFDSAEHILGGLDPTLVYALYASYVIPVKLSRIFFAQFAVGHDRKIGLTVANGVTQNKVSSTLAKTIFQTISGGVSVGRSYELPNDAALYILSHKYTKVHFDEGDYKDSKTKKLEHRDALDLRVHRISAILRLVKTTNGKPNGYNTMFCMFPYCVDGNEGHKFIFISYGKNDHDVTNFGDKSCTSATTMERGYMYYIKDIENFLSGIPDNFVDGVSNFISGAKPDNDNTEMEIELDPIPLKVNGQFVHQMNADRHAKNQEDSEYDSYTDDKENIGRASDRSIHSTADATSLEKAKQNDEFIDFSASPDEIKKRIAEIDAKNSSTNRSQQLSPEEVRELLKDLGKRDYDDPLQDRQYDDETIDSDGRVHRGDQDDDYEGYNNDQDD